MALGFYELRAEALPVAREALDKLNKRAAKNSLEAITLRVLDTRTAEHQRVGEAPEVVTWVTVSIEGIAPKLGDWQFAATLEHTEAGTLLRTAPTFNKPLPMQYRSATAYCEHCKSRRRRTDTYLVYSDTEGRFAQVGSNCLADFTGHRNPHTALYWLQSWAELNADLRYREGHDEDADSSAQRKFTPAMILLAAALITTEQGGYVSRAESVRREVRSTASQVIDLLWPDAITTVRWNADDVTISRRGEVTVLPLTTEVRQLATDALNWALDLPTNGSDYEHNVRTTCNLAALSYEHIGIATSALGGYLRTLTVQASEPSSHVGTVGNRIQLDVKVERVTILGPGFAYNSPDRALYILTQGANRMVWFSDAGKLREGQKVTLKATIKSHDDYRGTAQTTLTRCTII